MQAASRCKTRVISQREVSPSVYELTLNRGDFEFKTGAEITIHGPGDTGDRAYTVLSGERDDCLQILYRVIREGVVSPRLAQLQAGDPLEFTGPHGNFLLRDTTRTIVFVATGTGIAPAVSFLRTHPGLDLTLVHGVRTHVDLYYRDLFMREHYFPCVSREVASGCFGGRVTDWFVSRPVMHPDADYYLCGSNDMINEMRDLLVARVYDTGRIFAEPYYFW